MFLNCKKYHEVKKLWILFAICLQKKRNVCNLRGGYFERNRLYKEDN